MSPSLLQTLPYDILLAILCSLRNFRDLRNLEQTCKAFHEPVQAHSTTIISTVAPRYFGQCYPELLRLLRVKLAAAELPEAIDPSVYLNPYPHITKEDLPELFLLGKTAKGLTRVIWLPLGTTVKWRMVTAICNWAMVDILAPGPKRLLKFAAAPDKWHSPVSRELVYDRLEYLSVHFKKMAKNREDRPEWLSLSFTPFELENMLYFMVKWREFCHE